MFYIIGLGLGDARDITVKGLDIIKKCDRVYLESYTSILTCGKESLEDFYGREIIIADRDLVEQGAEEILQAADKLEIAFLVVGDPFGATTHTDLILRAKELNIPFKVVHNASILNAIGCCGLQLYNFGVTVSIPFWDRNWKPDSFFDKIELNRKNGMHTLCLLDIKVKEPTLESLVKKKKDYMPPRFMTVNEAASQILEIIKNRKSGQKSDIVENCLSIGLSRIGHETQKIIACSLKNMISVDLGSPLHSLIIPADELHEVENQYLSQFLKEI